jgi:hypothetical protein
VEGGEIKGASDRGPIFGRDSALRRPRRVQRRNVGVICTGEMIVASGVTHFRPLLRGRGRRSAASLPCGEIEAEQKLFAVGAARP